MASRWSQVKELFQEALSLPPQERRAFVDGLAADTAQEVASLLEAHQEAGEFIETPFVRMPEEEFRALCARLAMGSRVGPYRVLERLGGGGMGDVFRARDESGQGVAIKILRPDACRWQLDRLEAERATLADLRHPGIAKWLGQGTTESGLPYLLLELVDGEPVNSFCDRRRLGVNDRLRLFLRVCEPVIYLHRQQVVHGDLKPANILVTTGGSVKILDFGLARELREREEASPTAALTLAYASPEQLEGQSWGETSDVYSLGSVLYRLLTGHGPRELWDRDLGTARREVSERRRDPASTSWSAKPGASGASTRSRAARLGSTPDELRRRLAGELDAVLELVLQKDPRRRCPSVSRFSELVTRCLQG